MTRFLFTTCQAGAEPALKDEIAREYPDLKFAYSRPGFVTFKGSERDSVDSRLESVFARAYGLSLGETKALSLDDRAREAVKLAQAQGADLRLHVWERDTLVEAENEESPLPGSLADAAEKRLRAEHSFLPTGDPAPGELVFDVVLLEENHWWLGAHRHNDVHSRDPGGLPRISLPPKAPSRAYLKLEEGIRWSGAELKPKERALEIGSSPGGATFALLERGLDVVGIDPASMDPAVLCFGPGRFRHLKKGVGDVGRADLPDPIHWVLLDMNTPPQIALGELERLWPLLGRSVRGALLTLKLNRWRIAAEIPEFLERIEALGFESVRAAHLPSNRQEFFVAAILA